MWKCSSVNREALNILPHLFIFAITDPVLITAIWITFETPSTTVTHMSIERIATKYSIEATKYQRAVCMCRFHRLIHYNRMQSARCSAKVTLKIRQKHMYVLICFVLCVMIFFFRLLLLH